MTSNSTPTSTVRSARRAAATIPLLTAVAVLGVGGAVSSEGDTTASRTAAASTVETGRDVNADPGVPAPWNGDTKDHPRFELFNPSHIPWTGDTKDHPRFNQTAAAHTWTGDTKDHPRYR